MAGILWPVDPVDGAPVYSGKQWRQARGPYAGAAAGRAFGCRSGAWANIDPSLVTATATTWTVTPFGGAMDVEASNVEGCYEFAFDANVTGTVDAADQTNQRVDSLFVVMSDPAAGDGSAAPTVTVEYVAGLPGAAGGARGAAGGPPAFPARAFELAQITVPESGGGNPVVSLTAPRVVALGGVMPLASKDDYPAAAQAGQVVWDPDLRSLAVFDGAGVWRFPDGRQRNEVQITVGTGQTQNTVQVNFQHAFLEPPDVQLTMDGGGLRMGVNTSSRTTTGFVLNCWTSDNRVLSAPQTVTVVWVAFPAGPA